MKYIVDIKGEIEGDYEIIGKYEERPQGEWIYTPNIIGLSEYEGITCSICGNDSVGDFNFCPSCGADMRGGVEE